MRIRSFKSKAIKNLYREDDSKGVSTDAVPKLRSILTFLQDMEDVEQLCVFPSWKAHQLKGNRKGVWSVSVTRNWRLTFRIVEQEIVDVDYEDYH